MTSFFTTGGIRGGRKKMDKFYPRSFNMGVRREVYQSLGGFSRMRFGEDIDFSIRIFRGGYRCRLFPGAWVWHKRRTDLRKFFKQVHNSGIARINLYKKYPDSLKVVHLLPGVFTLGTAVLLAGAAVCPWSLAPLRSTPSWYAWTARCKTAACASACCPWRPPMCNSSATAQASGARGGGGACGGKDEFEAFKHNFYK